MSATAKFCGECGFRRES
ncbi:MAG: hypothetical protein LUD27_05590 [Clostridia bacterium]|nr:hypothetical protein [Clostridia bacterium]